MNVLTVKHSAERAPLGKSMLRPMMSFIHITNLPSGGFLVFHYYFFFLSVHCLLCLFFCLLGMSMLDEQP